LYWLRNTAIEAMLSSRFSFLGIGSSSEVNDSVGVSGSKIKPSLSVQTDKDVYRPGDSIFVTIEVANSHDNASNPSILVEKLSFEVKGLEKLDIQWFSTQKPSPGSKGRRGILTSFLLQLLYIFCQPFMFLPTRHAHFTIYL
jgi:hypothetical protein